MFEFAKIPSYDENNYHLAIIEKNNRFVIYLDLDGIYYFQNCIIESVEYRGYDHGMVHANNYKHFKIEYPILTVIRLFVGYPPRVSPPHKPPLAYRKPGKVLELAITLTVAEQLFGILHDMAEKAVKDKEVAPVVFPYGLTIEYVKNWRK